MRSDDIDTEDGAAALALLEGQPHLAFLDGHVRAFKRFGGVVERGIYGNLKAEVNGDWRSNGSSAAGFGRCARTICSSHASPAQASSADAGELVSL